MTEYMISMNETINRVIQVVKYTKKLPNTPQNLIIIKQLAKSVTSVGANDQEADLIHLCDL